MFDPDEIEPLVTTEVSSSALFASRFRECAARALLLPRRNPGKRSPLWHQRQRAAQLLDVARNYPDFPVVLEAVRECLQDVYDVPMLTDLMARIAQRRVRLLEVETPTPSPFAASLLFGYVGAFMYEGDSPWPNGAPPHWRWIRHCWPSCWAASNCANCSTPTWWPTPRASFST